MSSSPTFQNLILSLNAGSSSLKISAFSKNPSSSTSAPSSDPVTLLFEASYASISSPPVKFSFSASSSSISSSHISKQTLDEDAGVTNHESALKHFLKFVEENTSFKKEEVRHVCHRVVHGGEYSKPVKIGNESYHHIEALSDLAPLHNNRALSCISSCLHLLPTSDSIAFFDSAFHSTIPEHVYKYAIDPEVAGGKGLRKYGFHGLSYAFILRKVSSFLQKEPSQTTIVALHLGAGASACAILNGQSVDTSMGLTPLEGLPGATRSGHVDPSLIFHFTSEAGRMSQHAAEANSVQISEAEDILNTQSGWASLTGTSDFALISQRAGDPAYPKETLAFNLFTDRVLCYIGAYILKLGGPRPIDAIVFAGGIGERSAKLRAAIVGACKGVGVGIDEGKNEKGGGEGEGDEAVRQIGKGDGGMLTLVCRTDEQLEMARECVLAKEFDE